MESQTAEVVQRVYYFANKIAKEIIVEARAQAEDPASDPELEEAA